jgi:hypothetical protein
MAEVLRVDRQSDYTCQLTRTDDGFLVTAYIPDPTIWAISEWLHETHEAADACFETAKACNAMWRALRARLPTASLSQKAEALSVSYNRLCERLEDYPRVGSKVEALRDKIELEAHRKRDTQNIERR